MCSIITLTYNKNINILQPTLITFGVVIVALSKPTSAVILCLLIICYSFNLENKSRNLLIYSVLFATLISSLIMISRYDWSITNTIYNIKQALDLGTALSSSYQFTNFTNFTLSIFKNILCCCNE